MSNAKEIGIRLVELCNQGKNEDAVEELYADDIVSVEAAKGPQFPREVTGKGKILEKNQWWGENHEVHSASVQGPFPHGDDRFAAIFKFDVTSKPMNNQRFQMEEVAVYTVKDGKIVREEFYYDMG